MDKRNYVCYILDYWILLIFISFWGPQETILGPFGGPWRPFWHNFGDQVGLRCTQEDPEGARIDVQCF